MNIDHLRAVLDEPDLNATKYRLVEFLDSGGMGSVYVAEDTELERRVALKVLRLPDPTGEFTGRMIREAKIVARLEHPGIVPVHDIGRLPDGRPFYVSKLISGKRLDGYAQEAHPLSDRLRIFLRICEAVAFAHSRGVIHRDLKPQNIIIGEFGEVLVIDWGVAGLGNPQSQIRDSKENIAALSLPSSALHAASITTVGAVIGTAGFMAPEQERGEVSDHRSDIFSLGATLSVLARSSDTKLSRPLKAILAKATEPSPGARYHSVQEFADDISLLLDNQAVSAYRENVFEKLYRWLSLNRFIVIVILVYVIIRLLLSLIWRR